MTRADMEHIRNEMALTVSYLRETRRMLQEVSDRLVTASEHLTAVGTRIEAAMKALHGDDE